MHIYRNDWPYGLLVPWKIPSTASQTYSRSPPYVSKSACWGPYCQSSVQPALFPMYLNLDSPPPSTAKKPDALQLSRKSKARNLSPDSPSSACHPVVKNLSYALATPVSLPSESLQSSEDFVYAELIVNDRGEECLSRALLRLFVDRFNLRDAGIMQVFTSDCVFETRPSELTPAFTAISMLAEAVAGLEVNWSSAAFCREQLLLGASGRYQRPDRTEGLFQVTCRLKTEQFDYVQLLL